MRPTASVIRRMSPRINLYANSGATINTGVTTPSSSRVLETSSCFTFKAYFLEAIIERPSEQLVLRKCNITIYPDNTLSIYELKVY